MNFMHTLARIFGRKAAKMETENQDTEMDNDEEDAPVIVPDAQAEEVADPVEAIPAVPITPAAPISLDEMLALGGTNIQTGLMALRQNRTDGQGAAEALLAAESSVRHIDEDGGEIARSLGLAIDRQQANLTNLKASLNL